jgi:hypothetical protein
MVYSAEKQNKLSLKAIEQSSQSLDCLKAYLTKVLGDLRELFRK